MLVLKNFESNCNRIAKAIRKEIYRRKKEDVYLYYDLEGVSIDVSDKLYKELVYNNKKKYIKEINKNLKKYSVTEISNLGFWGEVNFILKWDNEYYDLEGENYDSI